MKSERELDSFGTTTIPRVERYAINLNQFILFEGNIGLSISTVSRACKN